MEVTPNEVTLEPGETATVSADVTTEGDVGQLSFSWSAGNSSVASVSGNGSSATVTGEADGTTSVSVSVTAANVSGAQTASTGVAVEGIQPEINSVSVTPSEVEVVEGETTTLTANVDASSTVEGLALSFSSSDANIAEVTSTSDDDGDGVNEIATLTANGTGTVAITVTASADNAASQSTSASVEVVDQIQEEAEVSINLPGGTTVSSEFAADVTVEPGSETVTEVRLLVDGEVVDSEQFSSSSDIQPQTNEQGVVTQAAPSTITFNVQSDEFNALTGENTFDDGEKTLSAELDTEERGETAVTASRPVDFDNESRWVLYIETQMPDSRDGDLIADDVLAGDGSQAEPGDLNPTAQGPAGFRWTTGHLTLAAVPVIYETDRSIRNVNLDFEEQSGGTIASSSTISDQTDLTALIERLTGETLDQTVMGFEVTFDATSSGVAGWTTVDPDLPDQPVIRSVDNSGNTGPSDLGAVLPAFFPDPDFIFSNDTGTPNPENIGVNLDNGQFVDTGIDLVAPSQMEWINEDYEFSDGFTVPEDPERSSPPVSGGVNDNEFGFWAALAGNDCPEGFGMVQNGQDVMDQGEGASATPDQYIACARWWDKFANEASAQSVTFGVDPFDPEIAYNSGSSEIDIEANGTMYGPGTPNDPLDSQGTTTEDIVFGISDPGAVSSGFSSTPLRATVERQFGSSVGGTPQFLCVTENNVVNGYGGGAGDGSAASSTVPGCSKSIIGTDPGTDNGSDRRDSSIEIPSLGGDAATTNSDGYYSVDAFVRDKAGNRSDATTVNFLVDTVDPLASGINSDVPLRGGQDEEFLVDGADNVDLIWATLEFEHASHPIVLHPYTGDGSMAGIQTDALGVKFDGETAFQESLVLGTTQIPIVFEDFLRGLQLMDGGDAPTTGMVQFNAMNARLYDGAPYDAGNTSCPDPRLWANLFGNCDLENEVLSAGEIEDVTGITPDVGATDAYDDQDFNTWFVSAATPSSSPVSVSGSATVDLEATVTFDENPGGDTFSDELPWRTVNGGQVRFYWKTTGQEHWHAIDQAPTAETTLGSPNEVRWSLTWDPDARVNPVADGDGTTLDVEFRAVAQNANGDGAVTQTFGTTVTFTE